MDQYQIGIIYKIYYNKDPNKYYISSKLNTINDAWDLHIKEYSKYIAGDNVQSKFIYLYFKMYGIYNFDICEIKRYYVIDELHLKAYEQLYINKYKCINLIYPFNIISNNYKIQMIIKIKELHKFNLQSMHKHLGNYLKHKASVEYQKKSYNTYIKEKMVKKMFCKSCGCVIRISNYNRHITTRKHLGSLNL